MTTPKSSEAKAGPHGHKPSVAIQVVHPWSQPWRAALVLWPEYFPAHSEPVTPSYPINEIKICQTQGQGPGWVHSIYTSRGQGRLRRPRTKHKDLMSAWCHMTGYCTKILLCELRMKLGVEERSERSEEQCSSLLVVFRAVPEMDWDANWRIIKWEGTVLHILKVCSLSAW